MCWVRPQVPPAQRFVSCSGWPVKGMRSGDVSHGMSQKTLLCLALTPPWWGGDNCTRWLATRKLLCSLGCLCSFRSSSAEFPDTFWKHLPISWFVGIGVWVLVEAWRSWVGCWPCLWAGRWWALLTQSPASGVWWAYVTPHLLSCIWITPGVGPDQEKSPQMCYWNNFSGITLPPSRQSWGAAKAAATLVAPTPLLTFGDHLIPSFWHLECDGACDGPISLIDKMGEASQTGMSPCSAFI